MTTRPTKRESDIHYQLSWHQAAFMLGLCLCLALLPALAQTPPSNEPGQVVLLDHDAEQVIGITTVIGEHNEKLIQGSGRDWRQLRNGVVMVWGGSALLVALAAIGLFYLIKGRVRLEHGRSGRRMLRWSLFERLLHWYTALTFIVLVITGLSLLLGRALILPLVTPVTYAGYAYYAMLVHNITGPLFAVGLVTMLALWLKDHVWQSWDTRWLKEGGGIVWQDRHPPAGRMNAGEKLWYYLLASAGMAVVISGLVLDFPQFDQTRELMQLSHLIHVGLGLLWTAAFLGHAYIGTLGMEATVEGMIDGKVDENWAKQHHRIWYEDQLTNDVHRTGTGKFSDSPTPVVARSAPPPAQESYLPGTKPRPGRRAGIIIRSV